MNLAVISSKRCWHNAESPSGFTTDGGFPMQMLFLSQLFDQTTVVVPCLLEGPGMGQAPLVGHNLKVAALTYPRGTGWLRKLDFPLWLLCNFPRVLSQIRRADVVHAPIPGDVGTLAIVLAWMLRKRLFVRHCGNWFAPATPAERLWKRGMEWLAGGRNVMFATGGDAVSPSRRNPEVRWIFSTSLTEFQLHNLKRQSDVRPRSRTRLILVCRQERLKGTGSLIASLPEIRKQIPEIELRVVGDGRDLPEFKALAQELGLADRVHFSGNLPHVDVMELLMSSDLFVFPTQSSEGFPKAVLEALACGLPVVATQVSVLPRLLASGGGVLLDSPSPKKIASAVMGLLTDRSRYEASAVAALRAAQHFSLEAWRDQIGEVLESSWGRLREKDEVLHGR